MDEFEKQAAEIVCGPTCVDELEEQVGEQCSENCSSRWMSVEIAKALRRSKIAGLKQADGFMSLHLSEGQGIVEMKIREEVRRLQRGGT